MPSRNRATKEDTRRKDRFEKEYTGRMAGHGRGKVMITKGNGAKTGPASKGFQGHSLRTSSQNDAFEGLETLSIANVLPRQLERSMNDLDLDLEFDDDETERDRRKVMIPKGNSAKIGPATKRFQGRSSQISSRNDSLEELEALSRANLHPRQLGRFTNDLDSDPDYDDDETEPPDDEIEPLDDYESENNGDEIGDFIVASSSSNKKGRGRYKGLMVDTKSQGGRVKLTIDTPNGTKRAVGSNARYFVNYCGYIVRTKVPIDKISWEQIHEEAGEQMWNLVEKISERNSRNVKKRKQKHITGNVSFTEHELTMVSILFYKL